MALNLGGFPRYGKLVSPISYGQLLRWMQQLRRHIRMTARPGCFTPIYLNKCLCIYIYICMCALYLLGVLPCDVFVHVCAGVGPRWSLRIETLVQDQWWVGGAWVWCAGCLYVYNIHVFNWWACVISFLEDACSESASEAQLLKHSFITKGRSKHSCISL